MPLNIDISGLWITMSIRLCVSQRHHII